MYWSDTFIISFPQVLDGINIWICRPVINECNVYNSMSKYSARYIILFKQKDVGVILNKGMA